MEARCRFPQAAPGQVRRSIMIVCQGRLPSILGICLLFLGCDEAEIQPEVRTAATAQAPVAAAEPDWPPSFGFGRPATPQRIAQWDIDVRPDGAGLPLGAGTAEEGAVVYAQKCSVCHGATGVEGPNDRLVGRVPADDFPFGEDLDTWNAKTIGGYWPYATTLYDYIFRAMPQNLPGSLRADEVYALTAFLLNRNEIIPEDAVMNAQTLPLVEMPARSRFVPDDRLDFLEVH